MSFGLKNITPAFKEFDHLSNEILTVILTSLKYLQIFSRENPIRSQGLFNKQDISLIYTKSFPENHPGVQWSNAKDEINRDDEYLLKYSNSI